MPLQSWSDRTFASPILPPYRGIRASRPATTAANRWIRAGASVQPGAFLGINLRVDEVDRHSAQTASEESLNGSTHTSERVVPAINIYSLARNIEQLLKGTISMARVVVEQLVADIDGGEAAETLKFSYRGVDYELELSEKNVAKMEKALDPYLSAARRVKGSRATSRRSTGATVGPSSTDVREWAKSQGIPVSNRGRVAAAVLRQYQESQR